MRFPSPDALAALAAAHIRFVVVHERFYHANAYRAVCDALDARGDMHRHGPFADEGFNAMVYETK